MSDMNPDPLDVLLRDAFARDLERTEVRSVTDRVMARIRRRQQRRLGILAAAVVLGAMAASAFAARLVEQLLSVLATSLSSGWQDSALAFAVVALIAGMWLVILEEEAR